MDQPMQNEQSSDYTYTKGREDYLAWHEQKNREQSELTTALREVIDRLTAAGNSIAAISTVAVGCKIDGATFGKYVVSGNVAFTIDRKAELNALQPQG